MQDIRYDNVQNKKTTIMVVFLLFFLFLSVPSPLRGSYGSVVSLVCPSPVGRGIILPS